MVKCKLIKKQDYTAWDIADADEETALRTSGIMLEKPEHIQELLAEATGLEMIQDSDKEQVTEPPVIANTDDRLRAVFQLSSNEKLIKGAREKIRALYIETKFIFYFL